MTKQIVVLAGDGIGPEIMESALSLLEIIQTKFNLNYEIKPFLFGGAAIDKTGKPLPEETLTACKQSDAILLGAIGGPKWDNASERPESGLLKLRKELGLYANIRPIEVSTAIASLSPLKTDIVSGSDFIVVRELTGGLYFGEPKVLETSHAIDTLTYTKAEIERILVKAFEIASTRRKKVTSVDKANVLASSKLWRQTANEVAANYPDVTLEHLYVDAAAMLLIQRPTDFDVIVTENLFGDILSDEASVITGSLGVLPSASHAEFGPSLYEPIHGSAPDIAGKNIANPLSMIRSVSLMLTQSFHEIAASKELDRATDKVMETGIFTRDLGGNASTNAFTKAVQKQLEGGE